MEAIGNFFMISFGTIYLTTVSINEAHKDMVKKAQERQKIVYIIEEESEEERKLSLMRKIVKENNLEEEARQETRELLKLNKD